MLSILKRAGAFFVLIPLLPLLPFVMLLLALHPFQWMYMSRLRVANGTTRPVWITPVGTFECGTKGVLEQFVLPIPAIPAVWGTNHRIKPSRSKWIWFHRKGLIKYEIVVRNADGEYRQVVIDPPIPPGQYASRFDRTHSIEEGEGSLSPISEDVLTVAQGGGFNGMKWTLTLIGVGMLGFGCWLLGC